MPFTELYITPSGNNTNSGSTADNNSVCSGTNGMWDSVNLGYSNVAGTFIGANVGDFGSIYADGALSGAFFGRIISVASTTGIYFSPTANWGGAPASAGAGMSCKVGGAWRGPINTSLTTTLWFPFFYFSTNYRNAATDIPRINWQEGIYSISGAFTTQAIAAGPYVIQGYSVIPGDSGRPTIQGPITGAAITPITVNVNGLNFIDLVIQNNGSTGAGNLFASAGASVRLRRILFQGGRGRACDLTTGSLIEECEAVDCNRSNTAAIGIIKLTNAKAKRCIVHDNLNGSNCDAFVLGGQFDIDNCIVYRNGGHGVLAPNTIAPGSYGSIQYSDFVLNNGDGFRLDTGANSRFLLTIENSNFVQNSGYGINILTYGRDFGILSNNGTYLNANSPNSGYKNTESWLREGLVEYSGNPYRDSVNGDFTLVLPESKEQGRGYFLPMQNYSKQNKSVVDIGAVQSSGLGAGGSTTITNNYYGPSASRIIGGM